MTEPAILMKRKKGANQVWDMDKFENKVIDMRDLYQEWKEKVWFQFHALINFSPLETISTSLWARLHHHLPVLSVFSHVSCQFVFA